MATRISGGLPNYAWLQSLGLPFPVHYFMPSDKRSVALDFTKDYPNIQDSLTLAHAFYPAREQEIQEFWGNSLRTIYAGVADAIKAKLGRFDLRLMCLALENEEYARKLLGEDPYAVEARKLYLDHGKVENETKKDIHMTIHSRIAEMKVLAAHLECARLERTPFSLQEFIDEPNQGVFVVSKDPTYGLVQDPMNGVVFWRLIQLLQAEQYEEKRKIFVIIDEFPTLAGRKPAPSIDEMFLQLRSRGVVVLIAYQSHTTLKEVYGDNAEHFTGQCHNFIYLSRATQAL